MKVKEKKKEILHIKKKLIVIDATEENKRDFFFQTSLYDSEVKYFIRFGYETLLSLYKPEIALLQ